MGILRPGDREPEVREIANEAKLTHRLFERLKREGPVEACYEAGVAGYDLDRQIVGLDLPGHRAGVDPAAPSPADQDRSARRGEWSCFSSPPGVIFDSSES